MVWERPACEGAESVGGEGAPLPGGVGGGEWGVGGLYDQAEGSGGGGYGYGLAPGQGDAVGLYAVAEDY